MDERLLNDGDTDVRLPGGRLRNEGDMIDKSADGQAAQGPDDRGRDAEVPDTHGPGANGRKANDAGTHGPAANNRDANAPGTHGPDANGRKVNDAGMHDPGANGRKANVAGTHGPDTNSRNANAVDTHGPDANGDHLCGSDTAAAVWRADDERGTARLAEWLAERAVPGTVIALDGDLGAGKTFFAQCFARALGVREVVNSPTFTIIREYEDGRLPLYHMDVYRLSQEEADELGLDEYFYGRGVVLVEWARLIPDLLPAERLAIGIGHDGGSARTIRLTGTGRPYADWCRKLTEEGADDA
jgi:tRNA threonylcarbamoyladenosine biosynthesis protein TsaE